MTIQETREFTQQALDTLDNFEATNKLDPSAFAVWSVARQHLVGALASLELIED